MIADLFIKILNLSIGAVPIMAVLLILRLLFKKAVPRKVFYIAWVLVFLRLMVPFSLESDFSFFNFMPRAEVVEENIGTSVIFIENSGTKVDFPVLNHPSADNPNTDAPAMAEPNTEPEKPSAPVVSVAKIDKNHIYGTIWIFGTAGLLLFGIVGYFAVLKKTKFESVPYTKNIRLSDFFKTPIVCGLFRPKIILPMNFDLDDDAKVKSVIAHECTHIRRGDNFWRLLASFTLYIHWFNPLVWICYDAFIRDMEVSCDEEVLGKSESDIRGEYAESLVSLSGSGTNPLYGGVLSFGESAIKERVKCIMNFKRATLLIVIICVAVAAALGVIFLTNPSMGHDPEAVSFEISGGDNISFSKENGLEINLSFTNTDDKTLWLSSEITVDRFKDGKGYTEKFESPYGTVMVEPGKTVVFCEKVPAEYCVNEPVYGEWTISRGVYYDKEFSDERGALFTFEIKENYSLETAEDIVAFVKENQDLLGFIENPAADDSSIDHYRTPMHWEKYKADNTEIPDAVIKFFYLYHSTFATYEVPDFSYIDDGTGLYGTMEQLLRYEVARERLESPGDYVTDFDMTIERESGENGTFIYSCLYEYKHKSGRESGGRDHWKFTLAKNANSGEYEIKNFKWYQEGYGGLYPGLVNIFEDIAERYYPYHNNDYELIANIGIVELLKENGYFEKNSDGTLMRYDLSGKLVSGSIAKDYIPNVDFSEEEILGDADMANYYRLLLGNICSGATEIRTGGITFVVQPNDKNYVVSLGAEDAGLLMSMFERISVMNVEPMPNPNTGGILEIYFDTESGIVKTAYDGRLVITHQGAKYAYVFDGELIKGVFDEIQNFADELLSGAVEYAEGEINPQQGSNEGPAPVQLGEEYLIPYDTGAIAGLFCNSEKTYIPVSSATALVELRKILAYGNFINLMRVEETETSELGKALEGVDVVEFARDYDGKKYNLSLYENGFILNGSAVDEKDKGKIFIVEKEAWSNFRYIVKTMFENASFRNPYWLGLANEKNIDIIWVALNNGNFVTYNNEMDCFELLVPIIKSISVEAPATRLTEYSIEEIAQKLKGDYIHVSMNFFTDTVYDLYITETELYIDSNDMKYSLYYKLSEPGESFKELYSFAVEEEAGINPSTQEENPSTAKPVIYLYPEKETEVSVKLDFDGKLTYTYPAINNGWRVLAKPDGTLTNLADGSTHYYLFWEGTARPKWTYEKGFVVKSSETESFLRENLAKMGLTPREYNDFITYWVPKMQGNKYNLISFSGAEYSEIAKLTVNPKPDSVIRIHMMWKALDEPIEIEPQVLPTYERKGFVLVEWGGTELY